MFVVGLAVGPAIGLIASDFAFRFGGGKARAAIVLAFLLVFVLFASFVVLELKLGLIFGVALGILLHATPMDVPSGDDEAATA